MFIRASAILFSVVALAGVVVAGGNSQCDKGSPQCCASVEKPNPIINEIFALLDLPPPDIDTLFGVTCSPFTATGLGSGNACTQQSACCSGDIIGGTFIRDCIPIVLNA